MQAPRGYGSQAGPVVLFAAVHESAAGTKRTFQDVCLFVRFWGKADTSQ